MKFNDGEIRKMRLPYGSICVGCCDAVCLGCPYFEIDAVIETCNESETFRKHMLAIKAEVSSDDEQLKEDWDQNVDVAKSDLISRVIQEKLDGFLYQEFLDEHEGVTPEALGVPKTVETHPRLKTPVDMYWLPGKPSLQCLIKSTVTVGRKKNLMPRQVYKKQPDDSFDYMGGKVVSDAALPGEIPSRAQVAERLRGLLRRGRAERNSSQQIVKPCSGVPSEQAAPAGSKAPFGKIVAAPATAEAAPVFGGRLFTTLGKTAAAPATVEAAPAPKPQTLSASALRQLPVLGKATAAPTANVYKPPMETASRSGRAAGGQSLLAWRLSASGQSAALTAASTADQEGGTKRRIGSPETPGASNSSGTPQPQSRQRTGSIGLGGSVTRMDLTSRLQAVRSADSECGSEIASVAGYSKKTLAGLSKFERCLVVNGDIQKALSGASMKDDFTQLKRKETEARGAHVKDFEMADKLAERSKVCASGCELPLDVSMELRLETVSVHVSNVEEHVKWEDAKSTFAELACRWGYEGAPPNTATLDIGRVLSKVGCYKVGEKPRRNSKDPEMFCDLFHTEELEDGTCMATMINFLEQVIIGKVISKGATERKQLVGVCKAILAHVESYPDSYRKATLTAFMNRLKGVIFTFSFRPYDHNTKIADADSLAADKSSPLLKAINREAWAKNIFDAVWLTDAQESGTWPTVERTIADFESADPKVRDNAAEEALSRYSEWDATLRDGCLPEILHPLLLSDFAERIKSTNVEKLSEDEIDPRNEHVSRLVSFVTKANSLWKDLQLTGYVSSLQKVAKKAARMNSMSKLDTLLQQVPAANADEKDFDMFVARIEESIPQIGAGKLCVQTEEPLRASVVMFKYIHRVCCGNWIEMQPRVRKLLLRLKDVLVMDTSGLAADSPIKAEVTAVSDASAGLQVLLELLDASTAYTALGDNPSSRMSNEKSHEGMDVLKNAKSAFDGLPASIAERLPADQLCQRLQQTVASHIDTHSDLYVAAALPPLESESAQLRSVAKGTPAGDKWSKDIPDECSWDFMLAHSTSLANVQKVPFIGQIRSVSLVREK